MNARLAIALGVLAMAVPAWADIDGKYKNDYSEETGGAELPLLYGSATVKKLGKAYTLTHTGIKTSKPGVGIKGGGKNVFFCLPVTGACGVAVYKIGADGALTGQWTAAEHKGKLGAENWAETGDAAGKAEADEDDELAGDYDITGSNPAGGAPYQGTVHVERGDNGAYKVSWTVAGSTYTGVGYKQDDYFGVAYGNGDYWLAAYWLNKKWMSGSLFSSGFKLTKPNKYDPDSPIETDAFADTQKKK